MTVRSPIAAPSPTDDERADRDVVADVRVGGDRRHRMDAGGGTPLGREEADGARKRQIRIARPQHRARRRRRVVSQDHRRGARPRQRRFVFRVGEKGEVARLGVLDAGDAR